MLDLYSLGAILSYTLLTLKTQKSVDRENLFNNMEFLPFVIIFSLDLNV